MAVTKEDIARAMRAVHGHLVDSAAITLPEGEELREDTMLVVALNEFHLLFAIQGQQGQGDEEETEVVVFAAPAGHLGAIRRCDREWVAQTIMVRSAGSAQSLGNTIFRLLHRDLLVLARRFAAILRRRSAGKEVVLPEGTGTQQGDVSLILRDVIDPTLPYRVPVRITYNSDTGVLITVNTALPGHPMAVASVLVEAHQGAVMTRLWDATTEHTNDAPDSVELATVSDLLDDPMDDEAVIAVEAARSGP